MELCRCFHNIIYATVNIEGILENATKREYARIEAEMEAANADED